MNATAIIAMLRTPDERFSDLPNYPFAPHYHVSASGMRMHYCDEGPRAGPVFLCLHGQPSWSYLYRKMIPVLAGAGRVIAPDLIGFGRSDKPIDEAAHSFAFHRDSLLELIAALDLTDITLVCQDWGGIFGLTLPIAMPERFARLIVMNTALATGENLPGPEFEAWRAFNRSQPDLDIAALMQRSTPILTDAEAAAYAAPFPDARYKAAVRAFPDMLPTFRDAPGAAISRAARDWWLDEWKGESFIAIGMHDQVVRPEAMLALRKIIAGCPEPMRIEGGHFVQEWGEPIARTALAHFAQADR
jgi:haloalkane dehalogenase